MPNPIPSQLALTNIADGSPQQAAPLRNNYSAIQAAVNDLIVAFGVTAKGDLVVATASGQVQIVSVGANGQVLTADSTQTAGVKWATPAASGAGTELDYKQITADVTGITATSEGTANAIITGNSITYDGTRVKVEAFVPGIANTAGTGSATLKGVLLRDSTVLGDYDLSATQGGSPAPNSATKGEIFDTPSAGAHTYALKAFGSGGTTPNWTAKAGAGGSGAYPPAWLRVTKA